MSLQRNLFSLIRLIPLFSLCLAAVSQRSTAPQDQLTHLPRQECPPLGGWCVVWAPLFHSAKEPLYLGPLTVRTPTPQVRPWASDTATPAWVSSSNTSSSSNSRLTSSLSTGATTLQGEHNTSGGDGWRRGTEETPHELLLWNVGETFKMIPLLTFYRTEAWSCSRWRSSLFFDTHPTTGSLCNWCMIKLCLYK